MSDIHMTNLQQGVLQLRHQLSQSLAFQKDAIDKVADSLDGNLQSVVYSTIVTSNDTAITIDSTTERIRFEIRDAAGTLLDSAEFLSGQAVDVTTELNGVQIADYIADIVDDAKTNGVFAEINDMYLSQTKVSLSEIGGLLETYKLAAPEACANVMHNLSSLTVDGKVTKQAWLGYIQNVSKQGKKAGDDQTYSLLDRSNPFVVINFFNIAGNIITSILPTLFGLISVAFTGILRILAVIFSAIFSAISSAVTSTTNFTIDIDQPYPHVNGPIITMENFICHAGEAGYTADTYVDMLYSGNADCCRLIHLPGVNLFMWPVDDPNSPNGHRWQANAYLAVTLHPDRFRQFCLDNIIIDPEVNQRRNVWYPEGRSLYNSASAAFQACYLTEEEFAEVINDKAKLLMSIYCSIIAFSMLATSSACNIDIATATPHSYRFPGTENLYFMPMYALICHSQLMTKNEWYSFLSEQSVIDLCSDFMKWGRTFTFLDLFIDHTDYTLTISSFMAVAHNIHGSPLSAVFSLYNYPYLGYEKAFCSVDGIIIDYPVPSPMITVPQLSSALFTAYVAIASTLVAGVLVGSFLIKRLVKYKSIVSKEQKAKSYKRAYDDYVSNPTGQNLKALKRAKLNYKVHQKLLGWDDYDPANSWFEANGANDGVSSTAQIASTIMDKTTTDVSSVITLISGRSE